MSADSELLIKIKTILESQGIDAAKAKLAELAQTTNAAGLSEAAANKERERTQDKAEKTARAILAMNNAMEGGMGPFRAAIHVANQLGGTLSMLAFKVTAISSVFALGFKIGSAMGEKISGAKQAEDEIKKIQTASDELRQRITLLNDIKLTTIRKEAESLAKDFATATDKAERLKRLSDLREDSKLASDLAGIELRFQNKEITQNERDRLEVQYTQDSELRKLQAEEKRILTQEELSKKKQLANVQTWKNLSKAYGSADQDYRLGIESAKDFGFDNPKGYASSGILSDKDQALLKDYRSKEYFAQNQLNMVRTLGTPEQVAAKEKELADAKKPEASLNNLRELKVQSDLARHVFEEFKGIKDTGLTKKGEIAPYKKAMDEEALRQEQLEADKDALVSRFEQARAVKNARLKGVDNRIEDDFDKAVADSASPAVKARLKGSELLDSMRLNFRTIRNNAGDPLSANGQAAYDAARSQQATAIVNSAMNQAYKGGDSDALTSALVMALKGKVGAEIMLSKEQVKEILDAIRSIGRQSSETTEAIRNLKSQSQVGLGMM